MSCTKGPCPCGQSSDAFATYDDGSGSWCFSCNDPKKFAGFGKEVAADPREPQVAKGFNPIDTELKALTARGITEDTMRKCDYRLGKMRDGTPVHVQLIKDETGKLIDQKTRTRDKQFRWLGQSVYKNNGGIIGEWSWPAKGKTVVITEGEIDRMSVSQAFDNKYPTGSLPNGSGSAKKALLASWEKLLRFDHIVLCFDNDEPGSKALKEACELLPVGRVKIMTVPDKDANATLLDTGPGAIVRAYWDAKPFRPDGIRDGREFTRESLKQKRSRGYDLPYPKLNAMWLGSRDGELTTIAAGSGIGKTTIARDIAYHLHMEHGLKVGNIYLEEDNDTSVKAYCALHAGVPLKSVLDNPEVLTDAQWDAALAAVIHDGMMFYDHFGSLENERLFTMMRYMAAAGCKRIVLDHISIVTSGQESSSEGERKDIDILMTKLASFCKETGVGVIAIVHLKRTKKDFNAGDTISLSDMRGSAAIEQLSFNVLAVERDQQDEDAKRFAVLRSLKCRITGETGEADRLEWNVATGRYQIARSVSEIPDFDPHEKSDTEDIKF